MLSRLKNAKILHLFCRREIMLKCSPRSLSMHMVDQCLLAIYRQCCIQFQFTLISALYYFHEIYYNAPPGFAPAFLKIPPPPPALKTFKILKLIPQAQWLPAATTSTPPPPPGNKRPAPLYKGYFKRGGGTLK